MVKEKGFSGMEGIAAPAGKKRKRELRCILHYRNLLVREATKIKNKPAGLLMEVGAVYSKKILHGRKYFAELPDSLDYVPESVSTFF